MPSLRFSAPCLSIAAALCVALPTSASGAVTIGSNLAAIPTSGHQCNPECTDAHLTLPGTSQAPGGLLAKSDGVVVRWRIKVGVNTTPVALRITRPGDSDTRTGAGTGPTVTPAANQTSTFDARLPIAAGDALGIDCCQQAMLSAYASIPGATYGAWLPPLVDGEPPRAIFGGPPPNEDELLINADIEPDADSDGFGDETQDGCPTDGSTQGACPPDSDPPETKITKGAPGKASGTRVKFKFTSSEPGSTFECKLDKQRFKPCESPRTLKRLTTGKHRFKVRAIDPAGNVDPTPASDRFRVVGS